MKETIIEGMLSEWFLHRLGVYAQTCAHIEKVLWHVAVGPGHLKAMRLRKHNPDLLTEAKRTAKMIDQDSGHALTSIVTEIESELYVRHMAVHGAWHTHDSGNSHFCEYFRDLGPKGAPDWRAYTESISDQEIEAAIEKVDGMLRRSLEVWQRLLDAQRAKAEG
jgi:hypothetical protein